MAIWIETESFSSFRCKCGDCRHTCCRGWQIDVSLREYFHLIGMNCSERLHEKLECAFAEPKAESEETFRIMAPNWRGDCHLLDDDGKCMLQKECGEGVLPKICKYYPRSLRREGKHRIACCTASCEAVVEELLREDRVRLVSANMEEAPLLQEEQTEDEERICVRSMKLLQDRKLPLRERIGRVCVATGCDAVPSAESMDEALLEITKDEPELRNYFERKVKADGDTERHQENLLANHLLYTDFPFVDYRLKPEEAGYGLMLAYHLLCKADGHSGEELADAYAEAFRLIEHTAFDYNAAVLLRSSL